MSLLSRLAASAVALPSTPHKKDAAPAAPQSPVQAALRGALEEYAPTISKIGGLFGLSADDLIGSFVGNDPAAAHAKVIEFIAKAQEAIAADHEQGICGCQQCVDAPQGEPKPIAGQNGEREKHS